MAYLGRCPRLLHRAPSALLDARSPIPGFAFGYFGSILRPVTGARGLRLFTSSAEPDRNRAEKLCVKMIAEYHGLNVG